MERGRNLGREKLSRQEIFLRAAPAREDVRAFHGPFILMEENKQNFWTILVVILIIAVFGGVVLWSSNSATTNDVAQKDESLNLIQEDEKPMNITSSDNKKYTQAPVLALKDGATYEAILNTSEGTIRIALNAEETPVTVNNFVFLAQEGFYDGTRSHRVIKDFMVQFGDPLTKDVSMRARWGTGDPGYRFADEKFTGEYERGTVAMANSGPNTNGSQFFIMHKTTALPKNYVIFGSVTDEASLTVLDAIANSPVTRGSSGENSSPTKDIVVENIEIVVTE